MASIKPLVSLETVLESIGDHVVMYDRDWRYVYVNGKAAEMLGKSPDELLGNSIWEVFPDAVGNEYYQELHRTRDEGTASRFEHYYAPWDRWFLNNIYPSAEGMTVYATDITAQKKTQQEASQREKRLHRMLDAVPQLLWSCNATGWCDYLSPQWVDYTGTPEEEHHGFGWQEALHPDDLPRVNAVWQQAISGKGEYDMEYRLRRRDGVYRWFKARGVALRDEHGVITSWFGSTTDIHEHKLTEIALRDNEERLRTLGDNVPHGAIYQVIAGLDGRRQFSYISAGIETMLGVSVEDVLNDATAIYGLIPEEDLHALALEEQRCIEAHIPFDYQFRVKIPSGEIRWLHCRSAPRILPNRAIIWDGIVTDITEYRNVVEALKQSEERLRLALDAGKCGVWSWDIASGEVEWSERIFEFHGLKREEFDGSVEAYRGLIHPADIKWMWEAIERAIDQDKPYQAEFRAIRPDGSIRWLSTSGRVFRDSLGKPWRMLGATIDITERRNVDEQNAKLLREVLRHSRQSEVLSRASQEINTELDVPVIMRRMVAVAMELTDAEGGTAGLMRDGAMVFNEYNAAGELIPIHLVFHEQDEKGIPSWVMRNKTHYYGNDAKSDPYLRPDLRDLYGIRNFINLPILDRHGELIACFELHNKAQSGLFDEEDLTLLQGVAAAAAVALENAQLLSRIRLADQRKDEFLATLAHELRNPLAPISNALHVLKYPDVSYERRMEAQGMIERHLRQMVHLVDDLLDVSRITRGKVELKQQSITLQDVLEHGLETVRGLIAARNHRLKVMLPEEPIRIHGDRVRLSQVFANLLNNAAKYTPNGGEVILSAVQQDGHAVISVSDTGMGIPPDMLKAIFELFTQVEQTLDRAEGGLGIGLTLVKSLVEMHGGSVSAMSDGEGKGTTFTVQLPLTQSLDHETKEVTAMETSQPATDTTKYRVLVVDDNQASAKTMGWTVELLGHEAKLAHDGPSAITLAREYQPHIILLDIGLPGMNGYDVCMAMKADPELKNSIIIAQTGWGQEEHRRRAKEAGFDHHLVKPVDMDVLESLLASVQLAS